MKKTTVFSIFGVINSQVVKEADELIADELVEMNRHAKFCYTTTEIVSERPQGGDEALRRLLRYQSLSEHGSYFLSLLHPLQPAG